MVNDVRPRGEPHGRDAEIAARIIVGGSTRAVAQPLGLSTTTVSRARARWRDHIEEKRREQSEETAARLQASAALAASTLVDLLQSPHDGVRLGAARTVLRTLPSDGPKLVTLSNRLDQLEAADPPQPWARAS